VSNEWRKWDKPVEMALSALVIMSEAVLVTGSHIFDPGLLAESATAARCFGFAAEGMLFLAASAGEMVSSLSERSASPPPGGGAAPNNRCIFAAHVMG